MALERPIFVVGCPRSGTTLVQCILSVSAQAFSLPETHFFSGVLPAIGAGPFDPIGPRQLSAARALLDAEARLELETTFWTRLQAEPALRAIDVFEAVVETYRPAAALRLIEKTPRHVLHLGLISQVYPDALFVNVVRDPVDVSSSLLGMPWESSRSVLSHAQRWTESVRAARAFGALAPERMRTVRYEMLVQQPERCTRELCQFVGLDFEPAMLAEFGAQVSRNVGRQETWKQDVARGRLLDRQGVWRTRMSAGQAWLVAQATQPLRGQLGYGPVAAPLASIASAALREAQVRYHEARPMTGVVGAARHAGSVVRTLAAA